MIAQMFHEFLLDINMQPAALQRALRVGSEMWSLAVQDLTQMGVVVCFIVIGWFTLSFLLWLFSPMVGPAYGKLQAKVTDFTEDVESISEECATDECSADVASSNHYVNSNPGLAILEQYGAFGASPGAWVQKHTVQADAGSTAARLLPNFTINEDSTLSSPVDKSSARTPRGLSLLEQYGVFGASPKAWRNFKVDHFGDTLTSFT